jgi:hypothetical protein
VLTYCIHAAGGGRRRSRERRVWLWLERLDEEVQVVGNGRGL